MRIKQEQSGDTKREKRSAENERQAAAAKEPDACQRSSEMKQAVGA
jgi:hypothetical protein